MSWSCRRSCPTVSSRAHAHTGPHRSAMSCKLLPCRSTVLPLPVTIQKLYRDTTRVEPRHACAVPPSRHKICVTIQNPMPRALSRVARASWPCLGPTASCHGVSLRAPTRLLGHVAACHYAHLRAHSAVSRLLARAQAMPLRPCVTI